MYYTGAAGSGGCPFSGKKADDIKNDSGMLTYLPNWFYKGFSWASYYYMCWVFVLHILWTCNHMGYKWWMPYTAGRVFVGMFPHHVANFNGNLEKEYGQENIPRSTRYLVNTILMVIFSL